MKICITSQGDNLDSTVDPRFGRCAYFIIYDTETTEFEAISNPNIAESGGAGIKAGQLISDKGVKIVLTGNIGPNAFQTLEATGIEIITGVSGTVKEVIEKYQSGDFENVKKPSVESKFGTSVVPQEAQTTLGKGRGCGRRGGRGLGQKPRK